MFCREQIVLMICPHCGAKEFSESKVGGSTSKSNVGLAEAQSLAYQCSSCKTIFKVTMPEESGTVSVKNKFERIMLIQGELMQTIKALKEKISTLEEEKASLMSEIETLRKSAEARAVALEAEVGQMREEAKLLRDIVGKSEPVVPVPIKNPTETN